MVLDVCNKWEWNESIHVNECVSICSAHTHTNTQIRNNRNRMDTAPISRNKIQFSMHIEGAFYPAFDMEVNHGKMLLRKSLRGLFKLKFQCLHRVYDEIYISFCLPKH